MTNLERREARYLRRVAARKLKKQKFLASFPSYKEVFTFEHLWDSFWLCRKEVSWKPSIQIFQQNLSTEIIKLLQDLHSEKGFQSQGFIEFNICERGKMRHIKSVNIRERIVQRCFCDYYLVPLLTNSLIYDNGASLKNKGVTFSLNRLKLHLKQFYQKYNTNQGYILLYDFSNFFGNIDHKILYKNVDILIQDNKCKKLYHHLIDAFGDVGLGLGSQVSQISAVYFPNKIDHTIMNFSNVENYARYMDDGYIIFKTKDNAIQCKELILKECKNFNIKINSKKIKICKINNFFIYIKKRFYLNSSGEVIMKLNKNNIYKHKRKIIKLIKLKNKNILNTEDILKSHKSWFGQVIKKFKNYKSIYNIDLQIRRLLNDR